MFETFLTYSLLFFTYCLAGWVWECIYMSILEKRLLNRGFLNGPYIPIYGFAGLIVHFGLGRFYGPILSINTVKIYFIGLICATTLEYITSVLLEKIFKAQWWDYTIYKFNFQGRICLIASLFWGVVSVAFVQIINPVLLRVIRSFPHDVKLILCTFMATLMVVDTFATIFSIINLHQKVSALVEVENVKFEAMLNKIGSIPSEYQNTFNEYKDKAYKIYDPIAKRFIMAFPRLHLLSEKREKVYEKIKNQINNYRNKF